MRLLEDCAALALCDRSSGSPGGTAFAAPAATMPPASTPGWRTSSRTRPAQGISQGTVDAALSDVSYSTATIRLDRNQKVFKQSFEKFSGRMIPPRIEARARASSTKHADTFARIEQQYRRAEGDRRRDLGAGDGFRRRAAATQSMLSAVATLAYDCRRSDFFRGQLVDALRIIERGDLTPAQMSGGCTARSGRRSSCPRPMSPSPSTSTATAAPT